MKAKNFIPLIFSLIFLSAFSYGQKKIDLVLIVETDIITQDNISETCRFEDQAEGTSIIDYTTLVDLGDEIKWKAEEAADNSGKVKLEKFKHESGLKFFNKDSIPVTFGRIKGTIVQGVPNEVEKYMLVIKVRKSGGDWTEYFIDPKLKMN
ncbi:hypothetical protein [Christiangramia sabulilitoris]|uniref:Uncharacterized protein n=1 Tax=Christiangramia sabulilitoris TaxID=2583991 RepID=A0A550I053_9FLAO|nr:hypothetical protein [Christiangramia sabulilitoris]TRO64367.1 hypothetical protein FGM01_12820 [Christiangramia sabulilitoris]